jgi:phosphoglycolate phosphatase
MPEAVLFDLDGTLIDSAPDLLAALDHVRACADLPASDHRILREHVSRGANGLLGAGYPGWSELADHERQPLRDRLLDFYAERFWERSAPFDGVPELIERLRDRDIAMGIVTNKVSRFAEPVLEAAGWRGHFDCVITGDRVARPKPDPEPVRAACQALGATPRATVFVGDDRRDVQAGAAARTRTVVAAWGYIPAAERPARWGADAVIERPSGLLAFLGLSETG